MRDVFFLSCTRGGKEETALYRSLQRLQIRDFHFIEHNQRGLPECYNEYLDKLAGTDQILVFVHSDVTIADVFVREKLNEAAKTFNIIGLVGSARFDFLVEREHYAWTVWPRDCLSGAVEHVFGNGSRLWFSLGPTPRRCIIMDGVLLGIDLRAIGDVRFDPRFTFHLYDLDFCLAAHIANLTLGTQNIYVQHLSCGDFTSDAYRQSVKVFRAKWEPVIAAQ
jgi:hypothetical protein